MTIALCIPLHVAAMIDDVADIPEIDPTDMIEITDDMPTAFLAAAVSLAAREWERAADARIDAMAAGRSDRSEAAEQAAARRYQAGRRADRARRARLPYAPIPVVACDDGGEGYLMRGYRWSTCPAATVVVADGPVTVCRAKAVYPW